MATIEFYKQALLFKTQSIASTKMSSVIAQMNKFISSHSSSSNVEEGALMFYMLNDAWGRLCMTVDAKSDLTEEQDKLARAYLKDASASSARLFYYMLLIITRESRHVKPSNTLFTKLGKSYPAELLQFIQSIGGSGSGSAAQALKNNPALLKDVTLGEYTACIKDVFNQGSFNGGFGGKPWGNIADTIRKYVFGETSIEIMNDIAWTLAHNGGPMFNKGMLYDHQDNQALFKILDVQRSGQIPQLVAEGVVSGITALVKSSLALYNTVFPEIGAGYVDWFKVEALGSLHKYPQEKKAQEAKHGKSTATLQMTAEDAAKFFVTDTEYATIVKRAA